MQYKEMVSGVFLERPNRFIAHVVIADTVEVVHVKNTGRCRELLPIGAKVWCEKSRNPNRKTKYDLICVEKEKRLINMDSQAPNIAVGEWLRAGGLGKIVNIRPEVTYGDSRFDFYFERDGKKCFMEVKGVTLENNGVCAFPDAPTLRGKKHLYGLQQAARNGYEAYVMFVIQMENVKHLRPNDDTDPDFGDVLRKAVDQGVKVLALDCTVTPESMTLRQEVPICL